MFDSIINHQGITSVQSWEGLTNPTQATCKEQKTMEEFGKVLKNGQTELDVAIE